MFFFLRLAWGNILKNRQNTVTILTVVSICVFFMEFGIGYMDGFKEKILKDALLQSGHIKIYNQKYYDSMDFAPIDYNFPYDAGKISRIRGLDGVTSVRPEINFGAIANSVHDNHETMVKAIDPKDNSGIYEKRIKSVKQGRFIEKDNELAIGYKAAKMLGVGPGDRIIIMTMDKYGGINAAEGIITGLMHSKNQEEDEGLVICALAFAQKALAMENDVTELIANVKNPLKTGAAAAEIAKIYPAGFAVVPWQKGQAYLVDMLGIMDVAVFIIALIIMSVAALGIVNSFLMNIMGRYPEFGIFRAIGVSGRQLFLMILAESALLGVVGTALGMIPGLLLNWYFMVHPISYESMGDAFKSFEGLDVMIGTAILPVSTAIIAVTGILTSILASCYPAFIAVNKKPVDILRSVQ
jgi:putative ABC transport system permease protein